jgi:hypothetical protein
MDYLSEINNVAYGAKFSSAGGICQDVYLDDEYHSNLQIQINFVELGLEITNAALESRTGEINKPVLVW